MSSQLLEYIKQETKKVLSTKLRETSSAIASTAPANPFGAPQSYFNNPTKGKKAKKKDNKDVEKFAKLIAAQVKKREAKYRKIYPAAMKSMDVSIPDGSKDQKIMKKVSEAFWKFVATGDGLLYTSIVRKAAQKGIDLSSQNEEVTSLCKKVLLDVIEEKDGKPMSSGLPEDYLDYIDGTSNRTMEGFGTKFRNAFIKNILLPSIKAAAGDDTAQLSGGMSAPDAPMSVDPDDQDANMSVDPGTNMSGGTSGQKKKKKKPGSGRRRHPLRARQERLSRRIKVPVAKIQDMLKPYFAGGGKVTFKESINRNIILEGDGAYGDETEAAIKAFQAQVNDLIKKKILTGVKPLGKPDGLFGPATLRAFQALKKQPKALAQSKLGSTQVDPNTLAGGAKQAAAQAAASAKPAADVGPQQPAADQGPPAPWDFTTLGQQKGVFGNSLKLLINAGGGGQTFTALQKIWQDSNIENTPPPQKLLKMYGTLLVKTTLTPDTMIPNQALLNQLPNPVKMEDYIEGVLYKQAVVDQLSNPNSAIGKLTSRLFKTQDALQLFLKQPDDSVAKVVNAEKKKVEKPFYEIDKDIKARKKTADDGADAAANAGVAADQAKMRSYSKVPESKVYAYLEKLINEEFDKILG